MIKPGSTSRPPSPSAVARLVPKIDKPLSADCLNVVLKFKQALSIARTGATAGALIVTLDTDGRWSADRAGQLAHDHDTLTLIACRILGECMAPQSI